jgi:signal recognition particle receptor subunit beta
MVSLATETDRTLFFDFLPLDLGKIKGFATKFQLYTVPGQVYYNATRKLVLRGVDGVVFVADSAQDKIEENLESFKNLEDNLAEYGYKRENIPTIIQYNKRDLPNALSVEDLGKYINKYNLPWSEAIANKGVGVFDSLKLIGKIVIDYLNKKYSRGSRPTAVPQQQIPPSPMRPPMQQAPLQQEVRQQQSAGAYNQLGGRPPFQGGAPLQSPPQQQSFQQQPIRQQPPPPASMQGRGGGEFYQAQQPQLRQPQNPMPRPQQQSGVPYGGVNRQPPPMQHAAPPATHPTDEFTFEPVSAPNNAPPAAPLPLQEEYFGYGSINLDQAEPQNNLQKPTPQESYEVFDQPQQPPYQQGASNPSGKTDLDLEIERYQREIEEKQRRSRGPGAATPPQSPQAPVAHPAPQQNQQPQQFQSFQQRIPTGHENTQQDYDVYNIETPAFTSPQQQQQQPIQPVIGGTEEDEMFFTSVDPDRQKKPMKRPVNPRMQQQKGFLSKFFNKDMP